MDFVHNAGTQTLRTWWRRNFEHCAQRKDPTGFWGRKPSGNWFREPDLLFTKFHQNREFSWKSWIFITTWLTLDPFKLFTTNFLEALPLRIWIHMTSAGAGQEENPNDRQNFAHRPKTWNFRTKKKRPNLGQHGPLPESNITFQASLGKPSLQAMSEMNPK